MKLCCAQNEPNELTNASSIFESFMSIRVQHSRPLIEYTILMGRILRQKDIDSRTKSTGNGYPGVPLIFLSTDIPVGNTFQYRDFGNFFWYFLVNPINIFGWFTQLTKKRLENAIVQFLFSLLSVKIRRQLTAHNSPRNNKNSAWWILDSARLLLDDCWIFDIWVLDSARWRLNCSRWLLNAARSLLNYAKWLLDAAKRLLNSARWLLDSTGWLLNSATWWMLDDC
jgi:hypothetical protein